MRYTKGRLDDSSHGYWQVFSSLAYGSSGLIYYNNPPGAFSHGQCCHLDAPHCILYGEH
jgi:hypothetical protein